MRTAAGTNSCDEGSEATSGTRWFQSPARVVRDPAPLRSTRRLAFPAGRQSASYGPIRASCASRVKDCLTELLRSCRLCNLLCADILKKAQFVQRAAMPACARSRKPDQVLMSTGEANVKAIAFRLPEKFSALRASPLATSPHRFPPSRLSRGSQSPDG